jgi:hypothetical protein
LLISRALAKWAKRSLCVSTVTVGARAPSDCHLGGAEGAVAPPQRQLGSRPNSGEDPLLTAFNAPPQEPPPGSAPVHHLIEDPQPPGFFSRAADAVTRSDADVKGMLDAAGDAVAKPLYAAAQGIGGGSFNQFAASMNTVVGHLLPPAIQAQWMRHYVDPAVEQESAFWLGPDATLGQKASHASAACRDDPTT